MMESIIITDNVIEMTEIGKRLMCEKPSIYTDKMVSTIKETVRKFLTKEKDRPVTECEIEEAMYRSVYDYWVYGNSCDEEFYYNFREKSHEEKLKYMTFRLRELYCKHVNANGDRELFVDKYKTYQRFKDYYLREVIQINSDEDYESFASFVSKHPSFVVKPKDMAFGLGVYLVKPEDYSDIRALFDSIRRHGAQNKQEIVWAKSDSIVIEELIDQDPSTAVIHPESVNGIRVTTVRCGNIVHIYHPWFKIGANGQFVTSAVCGTMDACINPETGVVETKGYKEDGEAFECHPNTGIKIVGFQIPRWNELLSIAKEVACSLDGVNYVGWDFVLTPNGWCIMEANYDGDFMWQMCYGKGMRQEFEKLIGWKMDKDFWWQ